MRCAYNEIGGVVNGINFFFERGDEEIVVETFRNIIASRQLPTSTIWNGLSMAPTEVLQKLKEEKVLEDGYIGVRFIVWNKFSMTPTIDEGQPLKIYLEFLRKKYPILLSFTDEISQKVFGIIH